jgi:hypothetical protein
MAAVNIFNHASESILAEHAVAVTPSDTASLAFVTKRLYVGGAGSVTVIMLDGAMVTYTAVPTGTYLNIRVSQGDRHDSDEHRRGMVVIEVPNNLRSAIGHLANALRLYVDARRADRAVIAGLRRVIELATAAKDCTDRELLARHLSEIAATAATSIDRQLEAGSRFYEISVEIDSMRELLEPGDKSTNEPKVT